MAVAPTAVLFSAGLDSAVLAAAEVRNGRVHPIYVSCGLAWEAQELEAVDRLLESPAFDGVSPIARLTFPARDLYPATAFDTPDEDVYLAGRNVMLLSKAAIHCARHSVHRIALATLSANPFPDATPEFFAAIGRALSLGLNHAIEVVTPFAGLHKSDVIKLGMELGVPLELTLSCMNPQDGKHCGLCSKCASPSALYHEAMFRIDTEA